MTLVYEEKRYPIPDQPEITIGRSDKCNIVIDHGNVSKKHCTLSRRNGQLFVRDAGSTNGTAVNNLKIKDVEVELQNGDKLILAGGVYLSIIFGEEPQSEPKANKKEGPLKLSPEDSGKEEIISDDELQIVEEEEIKPAPKPAVQQKPAVPKKITPAPKPVAKKAPVPSTIQAAPETTKSLVAQAQAQAQAEQKPQKPVRKFLGITIGGKNK